MSNYIIDRQYTDYIHENVAIPMVYEKLGWKELHVDKKQLEGLDIDYGTDYIFTKNGLLMTVQERFRESKYKNYTDFTIRYRRDYNKHEERKESEYYKMKAQYFTYGITNCLKEDLSICSNFLKVAVIDLHKIYDKIDSGDIVIRNDGSKLCSIENNQLICPVIPNRDGSSSFIPFDIPSLVKLFGKDVVLYSKGFGIDITTEELTKNVSIGTLQSSHYNILDSVPSKDQYISYLPLYSIRAACGYFGEGEQVEEEGWIKAEGIGRMNRNMFVVRAVGHSMEPRINDGDCCVFQANPAGSRQGKIILAQHRGYFDEENAGAYSIKEYSSEKSFDEDGNWQHEKIVLKPYNRAYTPIELTPDDIADFRVVGEFIGIIRPEEPAQEEKMICPECGGELVERKGPYGAFYGCSNYPNCHYMKKK